MPKQMSSEDIAVIQRTLDGTLGAILSIIEVMHDSLRKLKDCGQVFVDYAIPDPLADCEEEIMNDGGVQASA